MRVDHEAEVIVLPDLIRIAAHLVGDPFRWRRRVPAAGSDVEPLAVEHHPRFGLLGRILAVPRQRLDEVRDRRDRRVDRLVQTAVDAQRLVELHRPNGRLSGLVSRDDRRWNGVRGLLGGRGRSQRSEDRGQTRASHIDLRVQKH